MKRYSTLHPLVMAFYSPKIYRDVAYAWRGACILYLLILVALAQVPGALRFHFQTKRFVREDAPALVAQVPRMRFSGGTLAAEEPGVHRVVDPTSGRLLALFDTTGASRTPEETPALALFTATEVSIRTGERETETFPYSKNLAFTVTRERLTRFLDLYASYAAAALYPVAVALAMAFRVAQALLLSLAGLLLARWMRLRLPYAAIVRLSVASMTPAIVLGAACAAAGAVIRFEVVVSAALTLGYLAAALRFCKREG